MLYRNVFHVLPNADLSSVVITFLHLDVHWIFMNLSIKHVGITSDRPRISIGVLDLNQILYEQI